MLVEIEFVNIILFCNYIANVFNELWIDLLEVKESVCELIIDDISENIKVQQFK